MDFIVESDALYFRKPEKTSLEKIEEYISEICYENLNGMNGDLPVIKERLDTELEKMRITGAAYHFAILKELLELSEEFKYPIMLEGSVGGSIISYLLNISSVNPIENGVVSTFPEMIWGMEDKQELPCFTAEIAETIRPLVHDRLNEKFAFVDSDKNLYYKVFLISSTICEKIGRIEKLTGESVKENQYNKEVYLRVIEKITLNNLNELDLQKRTRCIDDNKYNECITFFKTLNFVDDYNLGKLTRIYGYCNSSFLSPKNLERLKEPYFFVIREEMMEKLLNLGIPLNEALNIVKKGIWSAKENKDVYADILQKYCVPEKIIDFFYEVTNLWDVSACISRLHLMCKLSWYEINYPHLFENINL